MASQTQDYLPAQEQYSDIRPELGSQMAYPSQAKLGPQDCSVQQYPQGALFGPQFQFQSVPPMQPMQPLQTYAVQSQPMQLQMQDTLAPFVGPQYLAPYATTFFLQSNMFSWSGQDATILDDRGCVVFTLDVQALSFRGCRTLKDPAGNPVCSMWGQVELLEPTAC